MKHIFLTILLAICSLAASAQQKDLFVLQPNGSLQVPSTGKSYLVVDYPGSTAEELKTKVINNVTRMFKDPKSVMSVSEDVVTVCGRVNGVTVYKDAMWGNKTWNMDYTITFRFKEEKLRIDFLSVEIVNQYGTRDPLSHIVKQLLVDGDGQFKKKRSNNVYDIVYKLNWIPFMILKADEVKSNEDW